MKGEPAPAAIIRHTRGNEAASNGSDRDRFVAAFFVVRVGFGDLT
jgi:hypothetical protein